MTAKESIKLAKMEQKVDDLTKTVDEKFGAIDKKLDDAITRMDNMNKSFVTVAQAKVALWIATFLISVMGLALMAWNTFHNN